ncbi:MAG: F0F1 ATP synthase subunit A [Lachnospiraceae bacterium]|nr:F0F1 ATP synthase subunit A [Lachnospiraceae bacterium]MCR5476759.1 F0F1 ATP synthase subunit A [Lachnospiraceae bacterium]
MARIADELMEQLTCEVAFTVHIAGHEIGVLESVVVSWVVIGVILILSLILTSNLKLHNISKRQAVAEFLVSKLDGMVSDMLGEEAKEYAPYLVTVLLFIGFSDIIGLFGFKPPTKDLNVTAALALMSIVLVQIAGIRKKKVGGWLKSFKEPVAIVTPINILELAIKPLSLCMRLFGNVVGAFVIMELLKTVVPLVVPAVFSLYFDIFDGILQAYVFVFLTSIYIKEAVE